MFIYKITEVNFCMSLRKYNDATLVANELSAYTPCLRPKRRLILTGFLLKFSQINLKIMYIQKIENKHFGQNYPPKGPFFAIQLIYGNRVRLQSKQGQFKA